MYKLMIAMFAMLVLAGSAWAQDDEDAPRCYFCGMFWEKSSTRLEMDLTVDGEDGSYQFESIGCAFNAMNEMRTDGMDVTMNAARILDYSSFGSKEERMIDAPSAWFLVGTSALEGSMGPYIAAFGSMQAAVTAQKELGGKVMNHDDMAAFMMGDDEEGGEHGMGMHGEDMHDDDAPAAPSDEWICPCTGGCCDDIHSDKPGKCPNCGMDLVKKDSK